MGIKFDSSISSDNRVVSYINLDKWKCLIKAFSMFQFNHCPLEKSFEDLSAYL